MAVVVAASVVATGCGRRRTRAGHSFLQLAANKGGTLFLAVGVGRLFERLGCGIKVVDHAIEAARPHGHQAFLASAVISRQRRRRQRRWWWRRRRRRWRRAGRRQRRAGRRRRRRRRRRRCLARAAGLLASLLLVRVVTTAPICLALLVWLVNARRRRQRRRGRRRRGQRRARRRRAKGGAALFARNDIGMVRVGFVEPTPPEGVAVGVASPIGQRVHAARARRQLRQKTGGGRPRHCCGADALKHPEGGEPLEQRANHLRRPCGGRGAGMGEGGDAVHMIHSQ